MNGEADELSGAQVQMPDDRTVSYVFPVEVVVVGALTEDDHRRIGDGIWIAFGEALSDQQSA
jgi:hypothetical protein